MPDALASSRMYAVPPPFLDLAALSFEYTAGRIQHRQHVDTVPHGASAGRLERTPDAHSQRLIAARQVRDKEEPICKYYVGYINIKVV